MNFMEPYLDGRNVTNDNFFTSYGLAKQLPQKKTSIVGTVNKVRRELPPSSIITQATRYSSVLMKANDAARLTIYQFKPKNMCVFLALYICLLMSIRQNNEHQRRFSFTIKLNVE